MQRLVKFDIGGIPYANTDFTEILQTEHIKCYAGILDGMNQNSYTGRNRGIILKGCTIEQYQPGGGAFYRINFRNSMIYLDGEFYTFNGSPSGNTYIAGSVFYLYKSATSSESRYLRDLTTTTDVIETTRFTYTTTEPATGPYIKFSDGGTSRYFQRILKFFTSTSGDIYISSTTQSFSATGLGFNDMEGFVMLNEYNTDIAPNLSGKFLRGYSSPIVGEKIFDEFGVDSYNLTLSQTPTHSHTAIATTYSMNHVHVLDTSFNNSTYLNDPNTPGGGYEESTTSSQGDSEIIVKDGWPTLNTYEVSTFMRVMESNGVNQNPFSKKWGMSDGYVHNIMTRGVSSRGNAGLDKGPTTRISPTNLGLHTHTFSVGNVGNGNIGTDGALQTNRPAYRVMVYYTKKYNFTWRD